MDTAKYVEMEKTIMQELCGDKHGAYALAAQLDNIVFIACMENDDAFIKSVLSALVDAYWQGYAQHETECGI